MKYRFNSETMKRVAARAAASRRSSKLERRLGAGVLAVIPRRDPIEVLNEAIRKAGFTPKRRLVMKRRRFMTDAEKLASYEARVERLYLHRWTYKRDND